MPAALTTGISTGVRIRIVGVMSIAVPTIITSTMMATISRIGLPRKGCSRPTTLPGRSATVISHAEHHRRGDQEHDDGRRLARR